MYAHSRLDVLVDVKRCMGKAGHPGLHFWGTHVWGHEWHGA